jgi:hypothetical protein
MTVDARAVMERVTRCWSQLMRLWILSLLLLLLLLVFAAVRRMAMNRDRVHLLSVRIAMRGGRNGLLLSPRMLLHRRLLLMLPLRSLSL